MASYSLYSQVYYLLSVHSVEKKSGHITGAFKVRIMNYISFEPIFKVYFLNTSIRGIVELFGLHHLLIGQGKYSKLSRFKPSVSMKILSINNFTTKRLSKLLTDLHIGVKGMY